MIVTCPACETRYQVDEAALGGDAGRRVRCASCGNIWHYSPEAAAIRQAIAEATAAVEAEAARTAAETGVAPPSLPAPALRPEPEPDAPSGSTAPTAAPRPSVAVELPVVHYRRHVLSGGLGMIVLAAVVLFALVLARDPIMAMWPSSRPVFTSLHLAEPAGAGLEVTVKPTRTPDSLVIDGDIVNSATGPREVPRLRITLRDGNRVSLESQVIDPPVASLAPGAITHFTTTFEHPSITASRADVSFVSN